MTPTRPYSENAGGDTLIRPVEVILVDGRNDRARVSSALFQSSYGIVGNFELALTNNRTGAANGDISHYWRDNDGWRRGEEGGVWRRAGALTNDHEQQTGIGTAASQRGAGANRHSCWLEGTDGNFHGICVRDGQVRYFAKTPSGRWQIGPLAIEVSAASTETVVDSSATSETIECIGAPALLQSFYGTLGDFEVVIPVRGGGMQHVWSSNDQGLPCADPIRGECFNLPVWRSAGREQFGSGDDVLGVRLLHTDQGHLVVLALERSSEDAGHRLVYYCQNSIGGDWSEPYVLEGSEQVAGIPGAIVSTYGLEYGSPGNLEVVAPAAAGGLLAWWRNGASEEWQRAIDIDPGGRRARAVHLIQSTNRAEGAFHGNFEVVAETGDNLVGFGAALSYTRDQQAGYWSGPDVLALPTAGG